MLIVNSLVRNREVGSGFPDFAGREGVHVQFT